MKRTIPAIILSLLAIIYSVNAQSIAPDFFFDEEPGTHNMGIAFDGEYYYTCNGGKIQEGKISKYNVSGNFMQSYEIELDMRSIMYNPKDKLLYVCSYDNNIYRITNLDNGTYQLVFSKLYSNFQASLAMDPKGKYIYYFDNGTLTIYELANGSVKDILYGLEYGPHETGGSIAVAVSNRSIITFNTIERIFYIYDKNGKLKESLQFRDGDYGFSLSYANGHIFVARDGNYGMGSWYGYEYK